MTREIRVILRRLAGILNTTLGDMPPGNADEVVKEVAAILAELGADS